MNTANAASSAGSSRPWWREPMVWLVIAGPLLVVVASLVSAAVAWKHIDPVVTTAAGVSMRPGDEVADLRDPKDPLAPALKARNHAASPRQ